MSTRSSGWPAVQWLLLSLVIFILMSLILLVAYQELGLELATTEENSGSRNTLTDQQTNARDALGNIVFVKVAETGFCYSVITDHPHGVSHTREPCAEIPESLLIVKDSEGIK